MNPITILDGILADYASARVRRLIHSLILLTVAVVTIWLAADKDWQEALIALAVTVYAAANKANTDVDLKVEDIDHDDLPPDDYPEGYDAAYDRDITDLVEAEQLPLEQGSGHPPRDVPQ